MRPPGIGDRDQHRLARPSVSRCSGRPCGSSDRVVLELPAVERERLAEVARSGRAGRRAIERHAEVGGRLEVVAGEHAEAAGVVRQHLGDAELHREVADGRGQGRVVLALVLVPARFTQVGGQVVGELTHGDDGLGVRRELGEPGRGDLAEHAGPGRARCAPRPRGRATANRSCVGGCQVHRRFIARVCSGCERRGQLGADGEATQSSHGPQRTGTRSSDRLRTRRSDARHPLGDAPRTTHVKIM